MKSDKETGSENFSVLMLSRGPNDRHESKQGATTNLLNTGSATGDCLINVRVT